MVEPFHDTAVVGFATKLIESAPELIAISKPLEGDALQRHVFGFSIRIFCNQIDRSMDRSDKSASARLAPGAITRRIHERDVCRNAAIRSLHFRNPRSHHGPATLRRAIFPNVTGHALIAVVSAI